MTLCCGDVARVGGLHVWLAKAGRQIDAAGGGVVSVAMIGLAGAGFGSVARKGVMGRFFESVAKTGLRGRALEHWEERSFGSQSSLRTRILVGCSVSWLQCGVRTH